VATRTEERMALAMSYVRCATGVLVLVPLLRWRLLERPALAVIADAAVIVESLWVLRRTRRGRTLLDPVLAVSDAAFAGLLALTVSRTVGPAQRDSQLIEVVSFALASAGFAGFGLGVSVAGVAVVVGLAGAWALAVWPDVTVKLVSDVLGFLLWFAVCVLVGREFRAMAALADDAQARSAALQVEMVERRRETDVARERELMHREIHEHLLPIVDAVAAGRGEEARLGALARREAQRARLLLVDGRVAPPGGLAALLADMRDTYVEAGLPLTAVFRLAAEPPPDVAEAVATAAREALSNVLKHAGSGGDVTLFAQADEDGLEIVVRDHGRGFAP
jgi:signal transduction histidine kinase